MYEHDFRWHPSVSLYINNPLESTDAINMRLFVFFKYVFKEKHRHG